MSKDYLHVVNIELTFAGFHSLKPRVISVSVAGTSAVLEPSTARSATTDSAGLLEFAALRALHLMSNQRGYGWRALTDCRGD